MEKIKVICLHDKELKSKAIQSCLEMKQEIDFVEIAQSEQEALLKIKQCNPDVIILDTNLEDNGSLIFLEKMFKFNPRPVILLSSLDKINKERTLKGLQLGAVDVIVKPDFKKTHIPSFCEELFWKIKIAKTSKTRSAQMLYKPNDSLREMIFSKATRVENKQSDRIIAIGSSTGGTEVINQILKNLPQDLPGIVIVQHMPKEFTAMFAERLDTMSTLKVKEAGDGDVIYDGHVYISPGQKHLVIQKKNDCYYTAINDDPPVNRFKPSVDTLFHSVALEAGADAVGIILTGMGSDGVDGMRAMRQRGAITIAQNKDTSAVYGMPREALEKGAAGRAESVEGIIKLLNEISR